MRIERPNNAHSHTSWMVLEHSDATRFSVEELVAIAKKEIVFVDAGRDAFCIKSWISGSPCVCWGEAELRRHLNYVLPTLTAEQEEAARAFVAEHPDLYGPNYDVSR